MQPKILFLDVDGVLNCQSDWNGPFADGFNTLDPAKCDRLARIVKETNAIVVLSSTWRLHADLGLVKLNEWLNQRGVFIHSHTKDGYKEWGHLSMRGHEIDLWLKDHSQEFPNPRFVILDDNSDMLADQMLWFVQTDWNVGLTDELADQAIRLFNLNTI